MALLLLLPVPGTMLIPTLAQGSKYRVEQGFMPCTEPQVKMNLKERSCMGQTVLDRENRSEKGIGLHGTPPMAGQVQHLRPSSVHCARSQSTKLPWRERSWSWSYRGPSLRYMGIHKDLPWKHQKYQVPSHSRKYCPAQASSLSWVGRRRYPEIHQPNKTHA